MWGRDVGDTHLHNKGAGMWGTHTYILTQQGGGGCGEEDTQLLSPYEPFHTPSSGLVSCVSPRGKRTPPPLLLQGTPLESGSVSYTTTHTHQYGHLWHRIYMWNPSIRTPPPQIEDISINRTLQQKPHLRIINIMRIPHY